MLSTRDKRLQKEEQRNLNVTYKVLTTSSKYTLAFVLLMKVVDALRDFCTRRSVRVTRYSDSKGSAENEEVWKQETVVIVLITKTTDETPEQTQELEAIRRDHPTEQIIELDFTEPTPSITHINRLSLATVPDLLKGDIETLHLSFQRTPKRLLSFHHGSRKLQVECFYQKKEEVELDGAEKVLPTDELVARLKAKWRQRNPDIEYVESAYWGPVLGIQDRLDAWKGAGKTAIIFLTPGLLDSLNTAPEQPARHFDSVLSQFGERIILVSLHRNCSCVIKDLPLLLQKCRFLDLSTEAARSKQ